MQQPDLIFPLGYKIDGFTSLTTSQQAGEPDSVVRELLQNGLDASVREARRERAEIHFTIARRALSDLHGVRRYRLAFDAARREREARRGGLTHDERDVIQRIDNVLSERRMWVLFCRDNGVGLNRERLKALISEGNSDKATTGAGSYGLGHLTAYNASDLHYVLYAGRRPAANIVGGRAILASHQFAGKHRDRDGYWMLPPALEGDFSLQNADFPNTVPPLLQTELDQITDSGTVVAICGFNHFHNDDAQSAMRAITRVAALNFVGAIHQDKMTVTVSIEGTDQHIRIDQQTVERALEQVSGQKRAPAKGWFPGSQGYRALQTLQTGRRLANPIDRSVEVWFRRLDAPGERARVQVFRDGMWITNDAPQLATGDFNGVRPFDAVVLLSDADPEDHTEFYDLIRHSEGPEHRDLSKLRKLSKGEQSQLREMLRQLAEQLRDEAGQVDSEDSFDADIAVFDEQAVRPLPSPPEPQLPQYQPGAAGAGADGTDAQPDDDADPSSGEQHGQHSGRRRPRRSLAGGRVVKYRSTVLPQPNGIDPGGRVDRLEAQIQLGEQIDRSDELLLRLRAASGSDSSCDQPIPPSWLKIKRLEMRAGNGEPLQSIDAGGKQEIAIAPNRESQRVAIVLTEPIEAAAVLHVDLIRRRQQAVQPQPVEA